MSIKDQASKLKIESRKLRVLLLTSVFYMVVAYTKVVPLNEIYPLLAFIGTWMLGQSWVDSGQAGKIMAELRAAQKAGLDPKAIQGALKDKDFGTLLTQAAIAADTLQKVDAIVTKGKSDAEAAPEPGATPAPTPPPTPPVEDTTSDEDADEKPESQA